MIWQPFRLYRVIGSKESAMDIYLQDLGRRRQTALLQWRVSSLNHGLTYQAGGHIPERRPLPLSAASSKETLPRLGPLGRLWARGASSPPEVVVSGLEAMRAQTYGMTWGLVSGSTGFWIPAALLAASGEPGIGLFMGALGVVMSGVGLWVPGYWLRRVCRPPVSLGEMEALQSSASDELEQAYLRLVADAVRQGVAPEAADRVRAALRAVGEAIDALPAVAVPRASVDALRAEAAQAQAEARAETDAVAAASHERRADALERSASAAQRSQTLMRRASALRGEMLAQIESLRLGLAGFETASGDVSSLASLADAVRVVAEESVSVADARAELDAALPGAPAVEMEQRLRAGG